MCKEGGSSRERVSGDDLPENEESILVNRCRHCGMLNPVYPEKLTKNQKDWIDGRNEKCKKWNEENGIKNCD